MSLFRLLMPTFSGCTDNYHPDFNNDNFYNNTWFSTVYSGKKLTTQCPIFSKLPEELIPLISRHLSNNDFRNLLLVDRAFCQLARSHLFTSFLMSNNFESLELMSLIIKSFQLHVQTDGAHPYLSSCFRSIRVICDVQELMDNFNLHLNPDIEMTEEIRQVYKANRERAGEHYKRNLNALKSLIPIFDNVGYFEFRDKYTIPVEVMEAVLSMPSLHTISLESASISLIAPNQNLSVKCKLRSIHAYLVPDISFIEDESMDSETKCYEYGKALVDIVSNSCQTVEKLWFGVRNIVSARDETDYLPLSECEFPQLTDLAFITFEKFPTESLNAIINKSPQLRYLAFSYCYQEEINAWLDSSCTIDTLKRFIIKYAIKMKKEDENAATSHLCPVKFISQQKELKELVLEADYDSKFLGVICPALQEHCQKLEAFKILLKTGPHSLDLKEIARLKSLKRLQITAGSLFGWRHDWFIDHKEVRTLLYPLKYLQWLAFSRDTYPILEGIFSENYYSWVDKDRKHLKRMKRIAEDYAKTFPNLKTIYVGKIIFKIKRGKSKKGIRWMRVSPEFTKTDDCYSYLQNFWSMNFEQ